MLETTETTKQKEPIRAMSFNQTDEAGNVTVRGPLFTVEPCEGGYRCLWPDGSPTRIKAESLIQMERAMMFNLPFLTEQWEHKTRMVLSH